MDRPPIETIPARSSAISATVPREPYSVEKRPTFGQWIKITWLDILTIFIVGAWAFPVYYLARPLGIRVFPLDVGMNGNDSPSISDSTSSSVIPPNLAYPARPQMVGNWLIALIAIAFPTVVILLMQARVQNFWDLNNGLLGFCYALLTSSAFQATVKAFVGGLRPNFYDVCQPDSAHAMNGGNKTGLNGIGFRGDMWTKDVCTTASDDRLRDAMQSFPSGHSTTITAAMVYLCLYLNAKLKVFANYHTPLWKLIALALPMLGAVLLCGTLIIDNTHNWYDIAGGATIGTLVAFASFRMVYASVFDWRFNHIPLNRNAPFDGSSRSDLVATTRAGWQSPVREADTVMMSKAGHDRPGGENGSRPSTQSQIPL
ncbi:PAP2 superfamily-domain-containing protein [Xylaria intraflava]|nr:PAP2 superfamily-domain-containing protein [Xylaria intraflava]